MILFVVPAKRKYFALVWPKSRRQLQLLRLAKRSPLLQQFRLVLQLFRRALRMNHLEHVNWPAYIRPILMKEIRLW